MSAIAFGDELVREYLVFRGFLSAVKAFDSEVKADKDRQFRPDRIVEHLSSCIVNLDLAALREAWAHLENRFFSRLEHSFSSTVKKLEIALLRMYLVTCISSGRQDKLLDFFEKMMPELQGQSEWKEWFALPFIKNPDENPIFAVFFSRQWQDTMLLSLHNFISVVFQSAAMPTLLNYEEELHRLQQLTEENEMLKKKLASLQAGEQIEIPKKPLDGENNFSQMQGELMDDFSVIAQEPPPESTSRSIKTLIRNISVGMPTSPVLTRRPTDSRKQEETSSSSKTSKPKPRSPSVPPRPNTLRSVSAVEGHPKSTTIDSATSLGLEGGNLYPEKHSRPLLVSRTSSPLPENSGQDINPKSEFIILSREKYSEHNSLITHCKFNCAGTIVASSDRDGVIKLWNPTPSISTLSTIMSKSSVLSLEWGSKRERLLFYGGINGIVRLYDTKERRVIKEVFTDFNGPSSQKILCICCNPLGTNFVTSTDSNDSNQLCLWDLKTLCLERQLPLTSKTSNAYCCSFNHNGQLLLVGSSEGTSCILDLRTSENIASWASHTGSVLTTQFSNDETACYTMGSDGKFFAWSVNKTGYKLYDFEIHPEATSSSNTISEDNRTYGKLFSFNSEGNHVLTCGPFGGVIYKLKNSKATCVLDIGGHNQMVNTVDWSTALECSTCICGTVDGQVIVSTLLNQ